MDARAAQEAFAQSGSLARGRNRTASNRLGSCNAACGRYRRKRQNR